MFIEELLMTKLAPKKENAKATPPVENTTIAQAAAPDISAVLNELQNFTGHFDDDEALKTQVRQQWGLNERDNVQIFVVPPGQLSRMRFTHFVTRPTTSKRLQQLNRSVSTSMGQLHRLEAGIDDPLLTEDERTAKIANLERNIANYRRAVTRERARISRMPRNGVIVVERH